MKKLNQFIIEKLKLNRNKQLICPKTKEELKLEILKRIIDKVTDYNDIDVSNIEDMSYLFEDQDIVTIDISEWDVSNVKNMKSMFNNCKYLRTVGNLSSWNINKVSDMSFMFNNCKNLSDLGDLSSWNMKGKNLKCMFQNCQKLKTLGDIREWNPDNPIWDIFPYCDCKPTPYKKP